MEQSVPAKPRGAGSSTRAFIGSSTCRARACALVAVRDVRARPSRSAPAARDKVIAFSIEVLRVCISWDFAHSTLAGSAITPLTPWPFSGVPLRQKRRSKCGVLEKPNLRVRRRSMCRIAKKAAVRSPLHNPPKLARLGDCGLKGVGAELADLRRHDVGIEPASCENQVWPIGRFAIGGHHVRSRPGDDDFMAVELDMKLHPKSVSRPLGWGPQKESRSRLWSPSAH